MGEKKQSEQLPPSGRREVTGPDGVRVEMFFREPFPLGKGDWGGALVHPVGLLVVMAAPVLWGIAGLVRIGRGRRRFGVRVLVHAAEPYERRRGFDDRGQLFAYQAWLAEEIGERGAAAVPRGAAAGGS
ncbi:hypothetical protein ACIQBJ_08735 [Kitasatospora sp. NPDC088391]|uniref:hypothetical protein n=1 Tax=Kitasatospora sp. NPDC088391 TaxID=3364074 RepID=UPI00381FC4A8